MTRCKRFKNVVTTKGVKARRCAEFAPESIEGEVAGDLGNDLGWDDFGFGMGNAEVAGPLIGGGLAQAATLGARLLFKDSPNVQKWAPAIGAVIGAAASGAMMMSPRLKATGLSGMITAALVGVPRQIEDLLMGSAMKDYLGVITAEQEMAGSYFGDEYAGFGDEYAGAQQDVQIMDSGSGSSGMLGVTVAEQEMNGADDVQMLGDDSAVQMLGGGAGFGSNFLQPA